jgi:hypothetical protein
MDNSLEGPYGGRPGAAMAVKKIYIYKAGAKEATKI